MSDSKLLDLPLEVRHMIYDYCLSGIHYIQYRFIRQWQTRQLLLGVPSSRTNNAGLPIAPAVGSWRSILSVNRQTRNEVFDLIFAYATFKIDRDLWIYDLPQSFYTKVQKASCCWLRRQYPYEISKFHSPKSLICDVRFGSVDLIDMGYAPGCGPGSEEELKAIVIFSTNVANCWTLSHCEHFSVMELVNDKERHFKLKIHAHAA